MGHAEWSAITDKPTPCISASLASGPRVGEIKNRALACAFAEIRGHTCLGPELCFYYTLSRRLRKAQDVVLPASRNWSDNPCCPRRPAVLRSLAGARSRSP